MKNTSFLFRGVLGTALYSYFSQDGIGLSSANLNRSRTYQKQSKTVYFHWFLMQLFSFPQLSTLSSPSVFVNTFVFLTQLMMPFTFSAVLFISPCCTWGGLYLYTKTLFVNDELSLTNYFAGILRSCHYFISNNLLQLLARKRRHKTCCIVMPWDSNYRNAESLPFLPIAYYLQSPLYLKKKLRQSLGEH